MKYPEIFDFSNMDEWKRKYLRKELQSKEWDLMLNEIGKDVMEIPFFTEEFCDKFVENTKDQKTEKIDQWGTSLDAFYLNDIGFNNILRELLNEYMDEITHHKWQSYGNKWDKMDIKSIVFKMRHNQDVRLHHDFVMFTTYMKLDSDSVGGELVFPKYKTVFEPKQGHIYIYPGRVTHKYGIRLIKEGVRTALVNYCL